MIAIKIKNEIEIFDFAAEKDVSTSESHFKNKTLLTNDNETLLTKIKNLDLMTLYLGEISSEKFKKKNLEEITKILLKDYNNVAITNKILIKNPRTFVHQLAYQLGVNENYIKIVK